MKSFTRQLIQLGTLASVCLLSITVSQATTTIVLAEPAPYCFNQDEWRGELNQLTYDHHLIIAPDDQLKNGDVFVGFRLKSSPETLWLFSGGVWSKYDAETAPLAYYSGKLQAVMRTSIIPQPMDLTVYGKLYEQDMQQSTLAVTNGVTPPLPVLTAGELLVGYGLRNNAAATTKDSFQDMTNNQRHSVVWVIGAPRQTPTIICLTATQITQEMLIHNLEAQ
ncbi:MAG: hypothetical protein ACXV8O_03860 [Methylobacter sp.]